MRVDSNRVTLAGGINQLDDAPYPAIVWVDAHLAGRRGQDTACARCDLVCFSERNKSDGWDKPDVRLAGRFGDDDAPVILQYGKRLCSARIEDG